MMVLANPEKSKILKSNLKNVLKLLNLSKEQIAVELGVRFKTVETWISKTDDHVIQKRNYERLVEFLKDECFVLYGTRNGIDPAFEDFDLDFPDLVESIIQHRINEA